MFTSVRFTQIPDPRSYIDPSSSQAHRRRDPVRSGGQPSLGIACLVLGFALVSASCADGEIGRADQSDGSNSDAMDDAGSWTDGSDGTGWDSGDVDGDGSGSESADDGSGGDGDGDGELDPIDWTQAQLTPQGHAWAVAEAGDVSGGRDAMVSQSGRLGSRVINTSQWLSGTMVKAKLAQLAQGDAISLSVELVAADGTPLEGNHWLELAFYDEPSLAPSSKFVAQLAEVTTEQGLGVLVLNSTTRDALSQRDAYWIALTIGGETLSGAVRGSSIPMAIFSETVDASGVIAVDGERLPHDAHDPVVFVKREVLRPGDVVAGLPGAGWTCRSTATALGYPRTRKWTRKNFAMGYVGGTPGEVYVGDVVVPFYADADAQVVQNCSACIRVVEVTEYQYVPEVLAGPNQPLDEGYVPGSPYYYGAFELYDSVELSDTSEVPVDVLTVCSRGGVP